MKKILVLFLTVFLLGGCSTKNSVPDYENGAGEEATGQAFRTISDVYLDRYFIKEYEDLYLEYRNSFDSARDTVEYVNTKSYLRPNVDCVNSDLSLGDLIMASKYYYLGEYVPDDLVSTDPMYGQGGRTGLLQRQAYEAFQKMYAAAKEDGMDLWINSFYRSYDLQVATYNNFLTIDPQEVVDTYSSRPGFSDHQTGLVCDILTPGHSFDTFHLTPEAKWLAENAHEFGFICRYPEGKQDVTQYKYEAWHYRYIGDTATDVYNSGLTYDEYYAFFIEKR